MKTSQILTASVAALCFSQAVSQADVTVRITGSTAFRAATSNAIKNILTSPTIAYDNEAKTTSFSNATWQTFVGTIAGVTGTVTVKTNWTGSAAGIRDAAQGNTIVFFPDGVATSTGGTVTPSPTVAEGVPDVAMADNRQGSTTFKTPALDTFFQVGIVPFAFVASKDTIPAITNITSQMHKALLSNGSVRANVFTNTPTDTQMIFAVGRDPFSGTRLVTLSETGFGTINNVTQYKPISFSATNTVDHIDIYPSTADVANPGNDGEVSGGGVAGFLRYTTTSLTDDFNGYAGSAGFIGYLGENDSYNAVWGLSASVTGTNAGNARYLTYNGVAGFGGQAKKPATVAIAAPSQVVTLSAGAANDTSALVVGQIMTGTGIAPGSKITIINTGANTVTLDKPVTGTNAALTGTQIGSLLPEQIRNGAYSFWNYEYILWKSTVVTGDKSTVAVALKNRILNFDYGFSGLADDTAMLVKRGGDGKFIARKTP